MERVSTCTAAVLLYLGIAVSSLSDDRKLLFLSFFEVSPFIDIIILSLPYQPTSVNVVQTPTVTDLVNTILPPGSGITVTKSQLTGDAQCAATFSEGRDAVNEPWFPDTGIILSSGGPASLDMQDSEGESTCYETAGDTQLDMLTGGFTTRDACILDIEFTVASDVSLITFK